MNKPYVYLAGPLFDEGERWFMEQLDAKVAAAGFDTFLPQRDNVAKTADTVDQIFDNNKAAIDRADLLVVNLNGLATDDGTAWELGYAYAREIHAIGFHSDWRDRFTDEVVNLMLERSLNSLARSLDELDERLQAYLTTFEPSTG
ncbi:MAG: nucleoside 2-deoxyribosyltransferase [Acidimicrobiales bacterium]